MQLGAGLGQGAVRDQNGSTVGAQAGEEGLEFALHAGAAKAQQGAQECGQWELAGADEGLGVIRAAGQIGKGRAVLVIREVGQNGLCKTTVLRRESCQPQKKIKQNQGLTESSSLSSVDWPLLTAESNRVFAPAHGSAQRLKWRGVPTFSRLALMLAPMHFGWAPTILACAR